MKLGQLKLQEDQGTGLSYWRKEAELRAMHIREFPSLKAYKEHQLLNPDQLFEDTFACHFDEIDRFAVLG